MKSTKDTLSEYGRDVSHPQRPRASSGGVTQARDVRNYSPPQGPTNINDPKGPGLHGSNCGIANKPVGSNGTSGSPGLHGENKGHGPNR